MAPIPALRAALPSCAAGVGRFLVGAGLAKVGKNGALIYNPNASNTYVIFVNDNGSTGSVAKPPFDPVRAKSTAYQTGVWVPGIVAGPGVKNAGRSTDAMVNIVDVFQLVGELAGIDVHATIDHPVDSVSMLPYLRNPNQAEIRSSNFTQIGTNEHANGQTPVSTTARRVRKSRRARGCAKTTPGSGGGPARRTRARPAFRPKDCNSAVMSPSGSTIRVRLS